MEEKNKEQRELQRDEVRSALSEVIKKVKEARSKAAKAAPHGLKRDPFITLTEKGMMDEDFIIDEFDKIQAKASSLPSGERDVIKKLMTMALHDAAVKIYQDMNQGETPEDNK